MRRRVGRSALFIGLVAFGVGAGATEDGAAAPEGTAVATFAGGCFWCVESDFDQVPGVVKTISGYTGGHTEDPTYREVTHGDTGHREAVEIHFDPARVGFAELVEIFWRSIDPTDAGGQFCDRGESYTTAIFTHSSQQAAIARASRTALEAADRLPAPVATRIESAGRFYPAEAYHQDYYRKNPIRYQFYRVSCRRNARVEALWGEEAHRGIEGH